MNGDFISMIIQEVRHETDEAVTIFFEYPDEFKEKLHYKPGQYITVKWLDGEKEIRRSYSISSIPEDPYLAITVKEVEGGKMSPLLCRSLKPGDSLDILPPEGRFTADFGPDHKRNIYLIGAGSGITPLISIARFVLEKEPMSTVILLYGSRSVDKIIFKDDLEKFTQHYKNQFFVYHTLSKPDGKGLHIMKSLFGKKKSDWKGLRGRISATQVKELIEQHPPTKKNDLFFLCGPGDLIVLAEKALRSKDIAEKNIKKEYFTSAEPGSTAPPKAKGQASQVKVQMRGEEFNLVVTDKTVLDTMLDEGLDAPYSCHSGACATCMAKTKNGRFEMDACFALSDEEIEKGYILACQARPLTETAEITFDE